MFSSSFMQQVFSSCWIELVSTLAFMLIFSHIRRRQSSNPKDEKDAMRFGKKIAKKSKASTRSTASTDVGSEPAVLSTSGSDEDIKTSGSCAQRGLNMKSRTSGRRAIELSSRKNIGESGKENVINAATTSSVPNPVSKDEQFVARLRDVTSRGDAPPDLEDFLKRRLQLEERGPSKTNVPPGLQEVLRKLTPEDAAIVRAAFSRSATNSRLSRDANIGPENTVRSNLRKLSKIDSKRVFMVRKIAKLGLNSPELLKTYFSNFGKVEQVYVTHSLDKRNMDAESICEQPAVRPAGVGFIVMETVDDVVKIFKHGLEHTVSNVAIALTAYEHHNPDEGICKEFGRPPSREDTNSKPRVSQFPSYANITEDNTLRANLRKMADIDASRIFMVRKMNKLGLGSAQLLKTHFGQFGRVTNVFVTHSLDRRKIDQENPHAKPAIRPAGIGFVVMDEAKDVAAIFQSGLEHDLYGVKVCVAPYEHQVPGEVGRPDDACERPTLEETSSNVDREREGPFNEELDC